MQAVAAELSAAPDNSAGDFEPDFRVLFSAIFHGISLGNFRMVSGPRRGERARMTGRVGGIAG